MEKPVSSLQVINTRINASPFNAWLGIEATTANRCEVQLRMPWRSELEGAPGMTHGGVFACIIDVAAYAMLLAAQGGSGPTIDMRVDFHANAFKSEFDITARLLRAGNRISAVEVCVRDADRRLLASGRAVYIARTA